MNRKTTRDQAKRAAAKGDTRDELSVKVLNHEEIHLKLLKWIFFEIVFVFMPLAFHWANGTVHGSSTSVEEVLGQGELLLVSVAITAAAVGDLVKSGRGMHLRRTKFSLVGFGIVLITGATWLYATAAAPVTRESDIQVPLVMWISVFVAASAILTSVGCLIAAEVK